MRWIRTLLSCVLAIGGLAVTHVSSGAPIEGVTQYHLLLQLYFEEEPTVIGEGFFRFDQAAVDQMLQDFLDCEIDCPSEIEIEYPMLAAEFEMYGHTFRDEDIRWKATYGDCEEFSPYCIRISMGQPGVDPYLLFGADDDGTAHFFYSVNGNFAHCVRSSDCFGHDAEHGDFEVVGTFGWFEEPVTASEPGTLALLGLGLLGLGLTRRSL